MSYTLNGRLQSRLASALPADRVFVAPGGHDWKAWDRLWADFLARGAFPGTIRAGAAQR